MAAIDKIYVETYEEYAKFRDWCSEQQPLYDKYGVKAKITDYMYRYDETFDGGPIFSAPYYVDAYLIRNCPFDFIQEELMIRYGYWSQKRIRSFYDDVVNWSGNGECPYWAKNEDFITLEDGTMTIKGLERSCYEMIKDGEMYTKPSSVDYTAGNHFRCIRHPKEFYNRPFKMVGWFVSISLPDDFSEFMWYHSERNTWDFASDFVVADWSSNSATVRTIKALKRHMIKWKLPVGTIVKARGRYTFDDYDFVITK